MEHCEDLLPAYLRFIQGVVDSADLPLNVSRQRLQEDRHIAQIRKWLTRKMLDALQEMSTNEAEKYQALWKQFGRALKEGAAFDFENRDRLLPLYIFESSHDAEKPATLKDYVSRMKPDQKFIYYITGPSRRAVEHSPHLEAFKERGYEVLFLVDPVDEILVQWVTEFEEKKLKSVSKGLADFDDRDLTGKATEFSKLMDTLRTKLEDRVTLVRLSGRLTSSPACLVVADQDMSPNLEKLINQSKGQIEKQKRIMEINPDHEVVVKMRDRLNRDPDDTVLDDYATILMGYALLAEGSELDDAPKFNQALLRLMQRGL
jgi:molecular chaperone HtpG